MGTKQRPVDHENENGDKAKAKEPSGQTKGKHEQYEYGARSSVSYANHGQG